MTDGQGVILSALLAGAVTYLLGRLVERWDEPLADWIFGIAVAVLIGGMLMGLFVSIGDVL